MEQVRLARQSNPVVRGWRLPRWFADRTPAWWLEYYTAFTDRVLPLIAFEPAGA
jgi:hypothetical protein